MLTDATLTKIIERTTRRALVGRGVKRLWSFLRHHQQHRATIAAIKAHSAEKSVVLATVRLLINACAQRRVPKSDPPPRVTENNFLGRPP